MNDEKWSKFFFGNNAAAFFLVILGSFLPVSTEVLIALLAVGSYTAFLSIRLQLRAQKRPDTK